MKHLVFLLLPFFTLSEVVLNFSNCNQFFLNEKPPVIKLPSGVSVRNICQCLQDNNNKKVYFYATLYSTTWKIPVYSAYVFGSPNPTRKDYWYIEPQLDGDPEPCMRSQGYGKNIGNNQAVNRDYEKSGYDKGHLYPVMHTYDYMSMQATSTLTNAAPQNPDFNRNVWKAHEEAVKTDLQSCVEAYVVTGVVPNKNVKINNRVTVSKYYWRATYCWKNGIYMVKSYYGPDNNGKVQELPIQQLEQMLSGLQGYGVPAAVKIFPALNP